MLTYLIADHWKTKSCPFLSLGRGDDQVTVARQILSNLVGLTEKWLHDDYSLVHVENYSFRIRPVS